MMRTGGPLALPFSFQGGSATVSVIGQPPGKNDMERSALTVSLYAPDVAEQIGVLRLMRRPKDAPRIAALTRLSGR